MPLYFAILAQGENVTNESMQRQWNNPQFLQFWKGLEPGMVTLMAPLFEALDVKSGERILDVGCGGGLTTLEAAAATGPAGHVTGADISDDLLELARSRAAQSGLSNVDFAKVDAQSDDLPGGPFDAAMSRLGVMFFADFVAAFANIRRHIKPGGRLAFVCLQDTTANPWFGGHVVAKYAPPRPPSRFPAPSPFALGAEPLTREFLSEAGFRDIRFTDFTDIDISPVPEVPAAVSLLAGMGVQPDALAKAAEELRAIDLQFLKDGHLVVDRKHWVVTARNP
ncbi:MAG: class I SAM-dependent methyltransferase [Tepidiformaceae bacterium]